MTTQAVTFSKYKMTGRGRFCTSRVMTAGRKASSWIYKISWIMKWLCYHRSSCIMYIKYPASMAYGTFRNRYVTINAMKIITQPARYMRAGL